MTKVSLEGARAHWARSQGLASRVASPTEAITRSGWLRTLGGIDVYLALRARSSASRSAVDALVASGELRVSMALRSCIYLVPRAHAAAALVFSDGLWRKRTERDLDRAGTTWKVVEKVGAVVLSTLRSKGPLTTDALRRAMPEGSVPSLGEKGKKVGLSSPLPVALRDLELRGEIERTLAGGKLDSEGYLWRVATKNLLALPGAPKTSDDALAAIVSSAVGWLGPVTEAELAAWIGVAKRDVAVAIAKLDAATVEVEGKPGTHFVLRTARSALEAAEPLDARDVRLLAFEDTLLVAHGGPGWLADPAHHATKVVSWGTSGLVPLGDAKHLSTRSIVVGGKLAGTWEVDLSRSEIVTVPFAPLAPAAKKALDAEIDATIAYFRELGHARSFSLDTDAAVEERAATLRALAGGRSPALSPKAFPGSITPRRAEKKPAAEKSAAKKPGAKKRR